MYLVITPVILLGIDGFFLGNPFGQKSVNVSYEIIGLQREKNPLSLLLTLDPDGSFRSIASSVISDGELKMIMSQWLKDKGKEPFIITLHLPNEKDVSFRDLGKALIKFQELAPPTLIVNVFIHSSELIRQKGTKKKE